VLWKRGVVDRGTRGRYDTHKVITLDKDYVAELDLSEAQALDSMILNCLEVHSSLFLPTFSSYTHHSRMADTPACLGI